MAQIRGFDGWLSDIADRSAALRTAVGAAPTLDARVPGCPEWSVRELGAHIGRVQRFWAAAVAAGMDESAAWGPPPREAIADPEPGADVVGWLAGSEAQLIGALAAAGPDAPCWTWWSRSASREEAAESRLPESSIRSSSIPAPSTAGAVARHQVQEAAVHAFDAQEAIGRPQPIPAAMAVDGVAEFLQVMAGSAGPWPHPPAAVLLVAHEGPSWRLRLDEGGIGVVDDANGGPDPDARPDATMRGSASDLVLALYRRIPLSAVDCDDEGLLRRLVDWPNTN